MNQEPIYTPIKRAILLTPTEHQIIFSSRLNTNVAMGSNRKI
jgi:hypothetical protein